MAGHIVQVLVILSDALCQTCSPHRTWWRRKTGVDQKFIRNHSAWLIKRVSPPQWAGNLETLSKIDTSNVATMKALAGLL